MPKRLLLGMIIILALWPGPGLTVNHDLTPREIYELDSPAVVMILGYSNSGQRGSGGTGSIIKQDGFVLTNAHVVIEEQTGKPYPRLTIYLKPDRVSGDPKADLSRSAKGRVVAFSQPLDLALLKLDGLPGPFPVLELDDSDRIEIGDRVVAIGHPEQGGLWTLTTGTISAQFENFNATKGKSVFQTETGLNRGNSGGPLLDTDGRMVGINTAIARLSPDGLPITSISFSLKSNVAKQWLRDQGVSFEKTPTSDRPALDTLAPRSAALPGEQTAQVENPSAPPKITSPSSPLAASSRPYNLDRLISERSRAEADLEDMIKEMRGKFSGR
ncbi:MAG TPA: trypsin-like peptidase domain-containing protein [Nitrospira sp.]|nr:trypsin-like peptidase domain-containing protein [Nitrospira sp.]